ncbi:hypothetical protein E4U43_008654 [Claviceps pusilla]|uniref:PXA domain-containing protein n=1 Tax=Claviceps pusilla TaxID=123648 RepID=A0A9P7NAV0_9HYPO|nr:hypothetical protein E4U43_008654 [Claviceps pusilla]
MGGAIQPAVSLEPTAISGGTRAKSPSIFDNDDDRHLLASKDGAGAGAGTIAAGKSSIVDEAADSPARPSVLATNALNFISTATPATLAAVAVAISAVIYALLGRIGLVLIGAIGGVLVCISVQVRNPAIAQAVRGEQGPDVLARVWNELRIPEADKTKPDGRDDDQDEITFKSFDDFRPETREALSGLVDAVVRDYIKWWYSPIIPGDHSFPLACRKTLNSYLLSISNRLSKKRPADAFLDLLTNSSSILIALLSELAAAFADLPPESNMTAADAVYNYLASNPDSRLANLVNQRQQAAKLRAVAEDLLGFLDQGCQSCDPARVFLREILANSVLDSALQICSKAEWINGWIVYLLEAGEPDLNQAIDVGMQTGRDTASNLFADIDGNVGNIGIVKPVAARSSAEMDRNRRKESLGHKKKLSMTDEGLEEAMEEMKRMNDIITRDVQHKHQDSDPSSKSLELVSESHDSTKKPFSPSTDQSRNSAASNLAEDPRLSTTTTASSFSIKGDAQNTPITPRSTFESSSSRPSSSSSSSPPPPPPQPQTQPPTQPQSQSQSQLQPAAQQFTKNNQITPSKGQAEGVDDENDDDSPKKPPLTLHNASFTLHDDSPGDDSKIRTKPHWDYLIQVEPSSSAHSGWMIVRRYSDFGTLHEIMRRIATISGATAFTELHKELPSWKIHTRQSLRGELERYLRDACWYQSLAESEGMKRFLEKSQGHSHGLITTKGFAWDTVGKSMLDVLTTSPKDAIMEGGKTLVGGVSGVFGNIAGLTRKSATSQSVDMTPSAANNRLSISTPSPRMENSRSPARSSERASMDSQRSSIISTQPGKVAPMSRRPSNQFQGDLVEAAELGRIGRSMERMEAAGSASASASASARVSRSHSRASSLAALRSPSTMSLDLARLPPPPDDMPSDHESVNGGEEAAQSRQHDIYQTIRGVASAPSATATTNANANANAPPSLLPIVNASKKPIAKPAKQYAQMSEQETRVAVELLFAVINEMYTLSSAWNIRRTLLAAAKSFLLRPGNPSLLTVQSLIQSSVLDANTSDAGIATQLRKLRENVLPTEQERASWPAEMTTDEKEKLAIKARRLLIQSGVPAALMGVMGQAATGEALGRVFDCLQIEEVARGLIFGLLLQAVRIVTH